MGQGLLIIEASRSYSDTSRSAGPLWTSDQPEKRTSDIKNRQNMQKTMHTTGLELLFPGTEQPHLHVPFRADTEFGTLARLPSVITNISILTY